MAKNKILLFSVAALLTGCSLAPDMKLPDLGLPNVFKEQAVPAEHVVEGVVWKKAESLEQSDRGQWWKIFGDSKLNDLESEAIAANQTLAAAAARVNQARAEANVVSAGLFPSIDAGANAVRVRPSAISAAAGSGLTNPYSLYTAQGVVSYEADLFGRVRNNAKAADLDANAVAASYHSVLLALQADVAQTYYAIRALDTERQLLRDTVKLRAEASRIMQRRFDEGEVGDPDLTRTQSELASTEAELIILDRSRAALEHALAVLLGKIPSNFSFAESPLVDEVPPEIPAGIPSGLLQRRPDIAAAQSVMAAANARIGAARAAFFPQLFLTASGGFEANSFRDLFEWSSRTWALGQTAGLALTMPIFDAGRNIARVDSAEAAYEESIANYRQQVLVAFRDVENNLADQRLLADQTLKQDVAAKASKQTTDLTQKRYDEGDADYFEVVDAQRTSLATERAAVQAKGQRLITSVELIRSLGGGWN
ncbi:MAG: efflux transporter outer membrane subunit [Alphaproteobacteria bacterium]|nr:MAG: efflux transporter outer membrane subunit [Alphaproteobacteria bacterium]